MLFYCGDRYKHLYILPLLVVVVVVTMTAKKKFFLLKSFMLSPGVKIILFLIQTNIYSVSIS